uniref:Store-operated calcium entry-associated regulatory factor n=1 Tax=Acrobeloides nanus TaxID=290746 RepID=A0A914EE64_9BILA
MIFNGSNQTNSYFFTILLQICLLAVFTEAKNERPERLYVDRRDRILRRDIQHITLYADQYTTGRRLEPAPQIQRIGGNAPGKYAPKEVHCYRLTTTGENQWECNGGLEAEVEFGAFKISCEGYDYTEDPYIVAGSCGFLYELNEKPISVWVWIVGTFIVLWIIAIIFLCCLKKEGYTSLGFNKHRKPRRSTAYATRSRSHRKRAPSISSLESASTLNDEDADDEDEPSSSKKPKKVAVQKKKRKNDHLQIVINI